MTKTYYAHRYRLDHRDRYFIWFQILEVDGDQDGVVIDDIGRIPVFLTVEALVTYAESRGLTVDTEDIALLNLDNVIKWLKRKRPEWKGLTALPCDDFLSAWNMFTDISRTLVGHFDEDRALTKKIYSKIFWGANIPAMTPEGEHYDPFWPNREKQIIREVMSQGLRMFRESTRRA